MLNRPLTELATFAVNAHRFRLEAGNDSVLRLSIASGREFDRADLPSYAVPDRVWPPVKFTRIEQRDGSIQIQIPRTSWLHKEDDPLVIRLRQSPFSMEVLNADGVHKWRTAAPPEFDELGVSLSRELPPDVIVYGFGELGETFDRRGMKFDLWNTDDVHRNPRQNFYCQIPVGIYRDLPKGQMHFEFCDNPGRIHYDLGFTDNAIATTRCATGDLVLWLGFGGPTASANALYTKLTGRMARPPLWALGLHQCRWSYSTADRVREIASEYRRRAIPCDAIYLDIDYMDAYRVFTWSGERFPDPKRLIDDLHADGFRVVAIVDPGVKVQPGDPAFEELSKVPEGFVQTEDGEVYRAKVWPGDCHFPDFTVAKTRAVWGRHQKRALLDIGVDGIWNDMNEPAVFDVPGHTFPDDLVQYDHGRRSSHGEVHQIYGHQMARASHEGLIKARPKERPFVITRSGWAGVQRHAMVWTGDNDSTWASMALDLQLNLSMGLSGVPFVGCDIGGFRFDGSGELFARWMEWGVFQPFCRIHSASGTRDQEPWSFGPEVEAVARRMAEIRMSLLPYIQGLFVEASETGAPVNRPMMWHHNDVRAARISDQFMLGHDIMVAPILSPGTEHRMVYFPKGGWKWRSWWGGDVYDGCENGLHAVVHAPLGRPAVFTRVGSLIPMRRDAPLHTGGRPCDRIVLRATGWDPGEPLTWSDGLGQHFSFDDGSSRHGGRGFSPTTYICWNDTATSFWIDVGKAPAGARHLKWSVEIPLRGRSVVSVKPAKVSYSVHRESDLLLLELDNATKARGKGGAEAWVTFAGAPEPAGPDEPGPDGSAGTVTPPKPAAARRPRSK